MSLPTPSFPPTPAIGPPSPSPSRSHTLPIVQEQRQFRSVKTKEKKKTRPNSSCLSASRWLWPLSGESYRACGGGGGGGGGRRGPRGQFGWKGAREASVIYGANKHNGCLALFPQDVSVCPVSGTGAPDPLRPAGGCPSPMGSPSPRPAKGSGRMCQQDLKCAVIRQARGDEVVSRGSGFLFGKECRTRRCREPSGGTPPGRAQRIGAPVSLLWALASRPRAVPGYGSGALRVRSVS